jgi:arginine/lysine/ornithine decarboxylase
VLLLVDNAHGAYLKFLSPSRHPMDLGADLCCDSAHKTLPVLTGGAYLHISHRAPDFFAEHAEQAMALFASTSPSYLILQSLDAVNRYLSGGYAERLATFASRVDSLKAALTEQGYPLIGNEPLKITVSPKSYGYTGCELAKILETQGLVCEFCDRDFLTLMLAPELTEEDLTRVADTLRSIPQREKIAEAPPTLHLQERALSLHDALLSESCVLPIEQCEGRILAESRIACPPAIPIVVCGERMDGSAIRCMQYYGITECRVIKEDL